MLEGVVIRRLRGDDRVKSFSAGAGGERETSFFRDTALAQDERGLSRTYVAVLEQRIVGYATIVAGDLDPGRFGSGLPDLAIPGHRIPLLILGRIATHKDFGRRGIASLLMQGFAFPRCVEMSDRLGCAGLSLDARSDVVPFYESKFGFVVLKAAVAGGTTKMFLPTAACRAQSIQVTIED